MMLSMSGKEVALFSEAFSQRLRYDGYLHQDMNLESLCAYLCIQELIRLKG